MAQELTLESSVYLSELAVGDGTDVGTLSKTIFN